MSVFLLWLPWIFRGVSILSGIVGLFQGVQIQSGEYSASPINIAAVLTWLSASGGSMLASFFASPATWSTLKKALDKVFSWVQARLNVDPGNVTDADERVISWLEDEILNLLQTLVSRWSPESGAEALAAIEKIRHSRVAAKSAGFAAPLKSSKR